MKFGNFVCEEVSEAVSKRRAWGRGRLYANYQKPRCIEGVPSVLPYYTSRSIQNRKCLPAVLIFSIMKFRDGQSKFPRVFNFRDFMLLAEFAKIRCMRKISILLYQCIPVKETDFKISHLCNFGSGPWIGSYDIPSFITHRPLSTYQISFKLEKRIVDAQRYVHTYGRTLRLDLLGRLGRVDKKIHDNNDHTGFFHLRYNGAFDN